MADLDIDALVAAEFKPAPPSGGDDIDALVAEEFARKAPRRAMGSTDSIGGEPAGESDSSSGFLDTAKRVGSAVVDTVTGESRRTAETESLPDYNLMPEMRQALVSNSLPALGSVLGPAVVGVEQTARNFDKDAPGFGLPAAASATKAALKTSLGTTMAGAEEQIKAILANNPNVKARKDSKGNTVLTSAQDGKDYIVPPGVTVFDAPRAAQTMAAAVPAATAGPATVFGRTLGNAASKGLAGAVGQTAVELAQSAGGGEFNPGEVVFAAGANAIAPAASAAKGAITASGEAALQAAKVDAAKRAAAVAAKPLSSLDDVIAPIKSYANMIDKLSPKKKAALRMLPGVGDYFDRVIKAASVISDEKAIPKEARAIVDEVLKSSDDVAETLAKDAAPAVDDAAKAADPLDAARARGDAVAAAANAAEPSASAIEPPTLNPTRTAAAPGRQRPAPAPQEPTPPTPQPAPIPEEVTATQQVPRLPPPTEGLEPTEVLSRETLQAAPAAKRRLSEDEAIALVRSTAIENGTRDVATIASKAGLPSSQVSRALERLVKKFDFVNATNGAPAEAAPTLAAAAPEVPADVAKATPVSLGNAPDPLPDPSLLEGIAARERGGRVSPTTVQQAGAVKSTSTLREKFDALSTPDQRMKFIAGLLDEMPSERVRTRLGITRRAWKRMSIEIDKAKRSPR